MNNVVGSIPFICASLVIWVEPPASAGDPMLDTVTTLNGGFAPTVVRDQAGNIYVAGITTSGAFPATPGSFQTTYSGGGCAHGLSPVGACYDVFVAKWDSTGKQLLWATYLGGTGDDYLGGMAVDGLGNVYLTGWTSSKDFPVTPGAFQTRYRGTNTFGAYTVVGDAFVAKLNASGTALIYATYLGGSGSDSAAAITVDAAGNAYVTGATGSTDFPVTAGALQTANRGNNAFIAKLNPAGSALVFATFIGGSGSDTGTAIATGSDGAIYAGGNTTSTDFPVTTGAYQSSLRNSAASYIGGGDAFVVRISASGSTLLSSTYFGGSRGEQLTTLRLGADGEIYIAGMTDSADLPVTPDALQKAIGAGSCAGDGRGGLIPCSDVFLARFDPAGTRLTYSTYLGGSGSEESVAMALDENGGVYLAGTTASPDYPLTADAFQPCLRSSLNAFTAKFKPGGPLLYSTYLGGSGVTGATGIYADGSGRIDIAGYLAPDSVPIAGTLDGYVQENDFPPPPVTSVAVGAAEPNGAFLAVIDPARPVPPSRVSCIVNAATMLGGGIAPGELVTIYGKEMGPAQAAGAQFTSYGTLSSSLAGVAIMFDGIPAPLISVQSDRVEAIVPYALYPNTVQSNVQIFYNGASTAPFPIDMMPAQPGVFSMDGTGRGQAAVLNEDGTVNSPANPAAKGSVISIFCTGLGPLDRATTDGSINSGGVPLPAGEVQADVGGWSADVLFAGSAPGQVLGVFQVNARVPAQPDTGPAVPVAVFVNFGGRVYTGPSGAGIATIAIR